MWPALAKANGIDPNSVTWVNIDANAKLAALKSKAVDATTSFFNLHHVFPRELGDDMGFLAWRDAGLNPYGNSIIVNGAWLQGQQATRRRSSSRSRRRRSPNASRRRSRASRRWSRRTARCCTTTS